MYADAAAVTVHAAADDGAAARGGETHVFLAATSTYTELIIGGNGAQSLGP